MSDELSKAVKDYLIAVLKDRHYCPRCMGMLPDKHYDDCALGKLAAAYRKVNAK
jgi:hypothetical protein